MIFEKLKRFTLAICMALVLPHIWFYSTNIIAIIAVKNAE